MLRHVTKRRQRKMQRTKVKMTKDSGKKIEWREASDGKVDEFMIM